MKKITPQELQDKLKDEKVAILDVRTKEKFELGHLKHKNANNIHVLKTEIFELENATKEMALPFARDTEVIVTCTTGNSATRCTKILTEKGYNVTLLDGGMVAWNEALRNE